MAWRNTSLKEKGKKGKRRGNKEKLRDFHILTEHERKLVKSKLKNSFTGGGREWEAEWAK